MEGNNSLNEKSFFGERIFKMEDKSKNQKDGSSPVEEYET